MKLVFTGLIFIIFQVFTYGSAFAGQETCRLHVSFNAVKVKTSYEFWGGDNEIILTLSNGQPKYVNLSNFFSGKRHNFGLIKQPRLAVTVTPKQIENEEWIKFSNKHDASLVESSKDIAVSIDELDHRNELDYYPFKHNKNASDAVFDVLIKHGLEFSATDSDDQVRIDAFGPKAVLEFEDENFGVKLNLYKSCF